MATSLLIAQKDPVIVNGDTAAIGWTVIQRQTCKNFGVGYQYLYERMPANRLGGAYKSGSGSRHSLLTIHGNVMYDLNYRSNIDTPYAEKDVYQHTLQTWLDITYKDNYPFRVSFTTRFSNSSYFRNFSNLGMRYDANDFRNRVRRQVQELIQHRPDADSLLRLKKMLMAKEKSFDSLNNWLSSPSQLQRIVAAREMRWLQQRHDSTLKSRSASDSTTMPDLSALDRSKMGSGGLRSLLASRKPGGDGQVDPAKKDSAELASFSKQYDSISSRMDSLRDQLDSLRHRYNVFNEAQTHETGQIKKEIDRTGSGEELHDKLRALHISDSSLPKGYQTLYSIKSFGLGRTLLDYSELSAKNISINGVQAEYNPSNYMALAVGTVDYRFRDYTMQNPAKGQYIGLVRYGWGQRDGNSVILTYYTGRRQLYNSYTNTQGTEIPNYHLMGFTVEGRYRINRTTSLVAEVAKSSAPYYSLDSSHTHNNLTSALSMKDHTNEAWSLKLNTFVPITRTQIEASYRRFGANFQSFSLFTTGSSQTAWSVRVEQPFFKQHLLVSGSVRTNDFANPLLTSAYKSSTVFKSIQATLRLKKWPVVTAGYFPSSQLTKIGNNSYQESFFYMLMGSVTHTYKVKDVSMIGMIMYTQFYNRIADSGFVYFNTRNLIMNQSAFIGKFTLQAQFTAATNAAYNLYTGEGKADYAITRWLSVGAGLKYNKQTVYNLDQWGYSLSAGLRVPKIGEIRCMTEKGYLPGNNRQLVVNKLGRLTYIKSF